MYAGWTWKSLNKMKVLNFGMIPHDFRLFYFVQTRSLILTKIFQNNIIIVVQLFNNKLLLLFLKFATNWFLCFAVFYCSGGHTGYL